MRRLVRGFLGSIQFLTRLPVPQYGPQPLPLSCTALYFPFVGALLGLAAFALVATLSPHLGPVAAATAAVLFLALITGALHEDGLADCTDGLGGGRTREQVLLIMRDSRIGSYGALAMAGSLLSRIALIAELAPSRALAYMVCAECLSRWTVLPLGFLPSAHTELAAPGQGARIAGQLSTVGVTVSTLFCATITIFLLRADWWKPWLACLLVTSTSAIYLRHRIGGVTGDCFGAVIQLAATAVYGCGAWR